MNNSQPNRNEATKYHKTTSDEQQATTVKQIAQSAANPLNIVQPKDELSHKGSIPRSKKNTKWISSKNKLSVSEKAGLLPQSNSKNLTLERKAESQENVSLTIDKQDAPSRGNQDQYFSEKASEEKQIPYTFESTPPVSKKMATL
ncbi:MAG: hypothetical protein R2822_17960 [Spirosomataceae bacterium]